MKTNNGNSLPTTDDAVLNLDPEDNYKKVQSLVKLFFVAYDSVHLYSFLLKRAFVEQHHRRGNMEFGMHP